MFALRAIFAFALLLAAVVDWKATPLVQPAPANAVELAARA
jgi:hypothetical protein